MEPQPVIKRATAGIQRMSFFIYFMCLHYGIARPGAGNCTWLKKKLAAAKETDQAYLQRRVLGGGEHQGDPDSEQRDGPERSILEQIVLQAHDADSQKKQAGSEEVLHLSVDAAEDEQASHQWQQHLKQTRPPESKRATKSQSHQDLG